MYGGSFGWVVVYQDQRIDRLCDVVCGREVSVLEAERAGVGVTCIVNMRLLRRKGGFLGCMLSLM